MGLLGWRTAAVAAFTVLSYLLWAALDGFAHRTAFTAIPLLFAAQVALSDALENVLSRRVSFGSRAFAIIIAPGTILHEFCHLLAALATGCTVTKAAMFRPNPRTGVLGYVSYTQPLDKWVVLREFIIGFAPFFGCGLVLLAFNSLLGGDVMDAVTPRPVEGLRGFTALAERLAGSLLAQAGAADLAKPSALLAVWIQLCLTLGAAPSTEDFKGAFTSLWRHLTSAAVFILLLAAFAMASDERIPLSGYEGDVASHLGVLVNFLLTILLLSAGLMALAVAPAYAFIRVLGIGGLAATIPVTSGFLAYHLLRDGYGAYAIVGGLAVFALAALVLSRGEAGGKPARKQSLE